MPTIYTLGPPHRRRQFTYMGSVQDGVVLLFTGKPRVTSNFFEKIREHFRGMRIPGGFNITNPTDGGLGEWVQKYSPEYNVVHLTPRHASFIAAILKNEGYVTSEIEGNSVYLLFP